MKNGKILNEKNLIYFFIVLLLGSLWGFSEVVLSSIIKSTGISFRAGILTGIGIGILAVSVKNNKKPYLLPLIAVIAILCKQLVVPMLSVSIKCTANSCLAVFLQSIVLMGLIYLIKNKKNKTTTKIFTGASAGFLSAAAFYPIGLGLAPCNYLLSFSTAGGLSSFMLEEGISWALVAGIMFPIGSWLGSKLFSKSREPRCYYAFSSVIIVLCWLSCVLVIKSGVYDYLLTM